MGCHHLCCVSTLPQTYPHPQIPECSLRAVVRIYQYLQSPIYFLNRLPIILKRRSWYCSPFVPHPVFPVSDAGEVIVLLVKSRSSLLGVRRSFDAVHALWQMHSPLSLLQLIKKNRFFTYRGQPQMQIAQLQLLYIRLVVLQIERHADHASLAAARGFWNG